MVIFNFSMFDEKFWGKFGPKTQNCLSRLILVPRLDYLEYVEFNADVQFSFVRQEIPYSGKIVQKLKTV